LILIHQFGFLKILFEYFLETGISTLEIDIDGSSLLIFKLFIFFLLKTLKFVVDLPMIYKITKVILSLVLFIKKEITKMH
jgi:hypothetical protein